MPIQLRRPVATCARLVPLEDRVAHALHGALRGRVGLLSAGVEDTPNFLRMRLEFFAACLNRLDPGDQIFGHQLLAIHAADRGGAAFAVNSRDQSRRTKTVCATRTQDKLRAGPDRCASTRCGSVIMLRTFARISSGGSDEPDRVAVGLRHAAAVEAGQARRFGQQMPRLLQCLVSS